MNLKFYFKKKFFNFFNASTKSQIGFKNIIIKGENKNWVLNQIASEYKVIFSNFFDNISLNENEAYVSDDIRLFIMSKYYALKNLNSFKNRIYFPYFHGLYDTNSSKENLSILSTQLKIPVLRYFFQPRSVVISMPSYKAFTCQSAKS